IVAANNKLVVTIINVLELIAQENKTLSIKVSGLRLTDRSSVSGTLYRQCEWMSLLFDFSNIKY
ncbi:MAG: hypothetical protein WAL42_11830, partial [Nitrososphaeraceae archaeon]